MPGHVRGRRGTYGAGGGTRTPTIESLEPKSGASTSSATPARSRRPTHRARFISIAMDRCSKKFRHGAGRALTRLCRNARAATACRNAPTTGMRSRRKRKLLWRAPATGRRGRARAGTGLRGCGRRRAGGSDRILLDAEPRTIASTPAGPGRAVLRFDGIVEPGRCCACSKGADARRVGLRNRSTEPTSLQWHGMRGPNALDGARRRRARAVPAAGRQSLRRRPTAALSWFHPTALPGLPRPDRPPGLRGVLIVEEPEPPRRPTATCCPRSIADGGASRRTAPLAVERRSARARTARRRSPPGGRLRLRLRQRARRARIMVLAVEGARPMIIAIDGQPSELFEPVRDTVPIGPGARFELMRRPAARAGAHGRGCVRAAGGEAPRRHDPART